MLFLKFSVVFFGRINGGNGKNGVETSQPAPFKLDMHERQAVDQYCYIVTVGADTRVGIRVNIRANTCTNIRANT